MNRPLIVGIPKRPLLAGGSPSCQAAIGHKRTLARDRFRPIPAGRSQQSFTQRAFRGFFPIDLIPQPMLSDCETESRQANEATDNDFYGKSCESFTRGIRQR